jgi:hypothetical protein
MASGQVRALYLFKNQGRAAVFHNRIAQRGDLKIWINLFIYALEPAALGKLLDELAYARRGLHGPSHWNQVGSGFQYSLVTVKAQCSAAGSDVNESILIRAGKYRPRKCFKPGGEKYCGSGIEARQLLGGVHGK